MSPVIFFRLSFVSTRDATQSSCLPLVLYVQELCYYGIFTLFYFIAGVVSAAHAYRDGAVVAAAVSIEYRPKQYRCQQLNLDTPIYLFTSVVVRCTYVQRYI